MLMYLFNKRNVPSSLDKQHAVVVFVVTVS